MGPGGKRKRDDKPPSQDGPETQGRPSPHRPENLSLAQHADGGFDHPPSPAGTRGGRRSQRGSRTLRGGPSSSQVQSPGRFSKNQEVTNTAQSKLANPSHPSHDESSNNPPATRSTQTQAQQQDQAIPVTHPPFYEYELVNDEVLKDWSGPGEQRLLQIATTAYEEEDIVRLVTLFQELIRSGLDGRLDPDAAGSSIGQITSSLPPKESTNATLLFLDTLSTVAENDSQHNLMKSLVLSTGISPTLLREHLDESLLLQLGLVRSTFGRVFIRKQTNVLYRQSNYNLLREETEGFSKLMTEFFTVTNTEEPTSEAVSNTFENIKALIGSFDLDAGRVLDVTLDVFASLLVRQFSFFIKFLMVSSYWPAQQSYESLPHESRGHGPYPRWGKQGDAAWYHNDGDESTRIPPEKKSRYDREFWDSVQDVGMDAFFELGGRKLLKGAAKAEQLQSLIPSSDQRSKETQQWIFRTSTLPPPGNSVAAQLLGFKLRFYASEARDPSDTLPVNLIYLSSLLIKIGFISLRDLYTHLFPNDNDMPAVKEKQMREKEEKESSGRPGGGPLNALARAAALPEEDTLAGGRLRDPEARPNTPSRANPTNAAAKLVGPGKSDDSQPVEKLSDPDNQKVELLKSLLAIGAIPEALYMIGRFPWLPDAFSDLPAHIHRILHHCLSEVYGRLIPLSDRTSVREVSREPVESHAGAAKTGVQYTKPEPRKPKKWPKIDETDPSNPGAEYKFYFDHWTDNIPVCQTVDDVFSLCRTFLNLSGIKIGQDASLLTKLARIGQHSLKNDSSETNRSRWIDLCKRLLCPALSLSGSNPSLVKEIFEVLRFFPIHNRYAIYAEWFQGQASRVPDVSNAFAVATVKTKNLLKRINNNNTREMARDMAKISCACPGIVFIAVLTHIEAYSNLADVIVECVRYFTELSHDVLIWSLLSLLGKEGRNRVSASGFSASSWVQSLSFFTGRVFKRWIEMNTIPVLRYILQQLRRHNWTDLILLKDLMTSMGGIVSDTNFNESQVLAMSGGELLQSLTLLQLQDKRHECKASGKRLIRSLVENELTAPFIISLAQERQMSVFNVDGNSNKVFSETFDQIGIVMAHYLDMLNGHVSARELSSLIPGVPALISEFGIEPGVAFTIHRRSIAQTITDYDAGHEFEKRTLKYPITNHRSNDPDTESTEAASLENPPVESDSTPKNNVNDFTVGMEDLPPGIQDKQDAEEALKTGNAETLPNSDSAQVWHPVLGRIMEELSFVLPGTITSALSVSFLVTFWQLSLSDIAAPSGSYEAESKSQKQRLAALNSGRHDMTTSGIKKREQEKKGLHANIENLSKEMKAQLKSYQEVNRRLIKEKDHWFKGVDVPWRVLNMAIMEACFLPRLLMSPLDAYYTSKFFFFIHSTGTPGFRTIGFLDQLFSEKTLTNVIYSCSNRESENLGRFLNEIFRVLHEWHRDRATYEKKALGRNRNLPGFGKNANPQGAEQLTDYEDFRRVLFKWHRNFCMSLKTSLRSFDFMHVKNAINVLSYAADHFPAVTSMAKGLFDAADEVRLRESAPARGEPPKPLHREDLSTAAASVLGKIKAREKRWILDKDFCQHDYLHKNQKRESNGATSTAPGESDGGRVTPQYLNATAKIFEPEATQSSASNIGQASKMEVEDGEVNSVRLTSEKSNSAGVPTTSTAAEPSNGPAILHSDSVQQRADNEVGTAEDMTNDNNSEPTLPADGTEFSSTKDTGEPPAHHSTRLGLRETDLGLMDNNPRPARNRQDNLAVPPKLSTKRPDAFETQNKTSNIRLRHSDSSPLQQDLQVSETADDAWTGSRNKTSRASTQDRDWYDAGERRQPRGDQQGRGHQQSTHERSRDSIAPYSVNSRPPQNSYGKSTNQLTGNVRTDSGADTKNNADLESVNPERVALMMDPAVQDSKGRHDGYENSSQSQRHSRHTSPTARETRSSYRSGPNPDQAKESYAASYKGISPKPSSRYRDHRLDLMSESAPSGPRSVQTRPDFRETDDFRRPDVMGPPQFRPQDRGSMRFGPEMSQPPIRQDPNFGRLNSGSSSAQSTQVRGPPNEVTPQGLSQSQIGESRRIRSNAPGSVTVAPEGRHSAEMSSQQRTEHQHHSTLRQAETTPPSSENVSASTSGVHPSRLRQIEGQPARPQPLQTNAPEASSQRSTSYAPSPTSSVPSGPRSSHAQAAEAYKSNTPLASPSLRSPSSGPSPSHPDNANGRRQLAGIRETLQHSTQPQPFSGPVQGAGPRPHPPNDRGTSIRGRASAGRGEQDSRDLPNAAKDSLKNQEIGPADYDYDSRRDSRTNRMMARPGMEPPSPRDRRNFAAPMDAPPRGRDGSSSTAPVDPTRASRPSRESSRQAFDGQREWIRPRNAEYTHPRKIAYEERRPRGAGPEERGPRPVEPFSETTRGYAGRERERGARRDRPDDRGYGRGGAFAPSASADESGRAGPRYSAPGFQGPGPWGDDGRGEGRRGDGGRERWDGMGNGGGLRKRGWPGEEPEPDESRYADDIFNVSRPEVHLEAAIDLKLHKVMHLYGPRRFPFCLRPCHGPSSSIFARAICRARRSISTSKASPTTTHVTTAADDASVPSSRLNPDPDSYNITPFTDRCTLTLQSGGGGHGCVSFLREKFVDDGPPNGGDGGEGGSVWIQAVRGETSLHKLARRGAVKAGKGGNGRGKGKGGERGADVLVTVPVGTVVREVDRYDPREQVNAAEEGEEQDAQLLRARSKWITFPGMSTTELKYTEPPKIPRSKSSMALAAQPKAPIRLDLDTPMEKPLLLAAGSVGGLGNPNFVSRSLHRPKYATRGEPGLRMLLELELKMLADVGLVGLPNAGKSTLLRALTNSRTRIGDWEFTTLQPSIGTVVLDNHKGRPLYEAYEKNGQPRANFTIADIPGLIEDAHLDRGLGLGFLRHVERAAVLAFVIDLSAGDAVGALQSLWVEVAEYEASRNREINTESESRVGGTCLDIDNDSLPRLLPPISSKPWFVVATKADLPGTQANFASLRTYMGMIGEGQAGHPSGKRNAWKKRLATIPVSAVRAEGVDMIPKLVIDLLKG